MKAAALPAEAATKAGRIIISCPLVQQNRRTGTAKTGWKGESGRLMAKISPMMQQYLEIKNAYPDALLFFRLGDFYEMFFEDAKTASRELELVLTGRDCGQEERAPMCGVPFHSADNYIAKLVGRGYKVAICEQMEDPAQAKGIVKRDVIRVITPGTVIESGMLEEGQNNYLATVCCAEGQVGVCFADISTGMFHVTSFSGEDVEDKVVNQLSAYQPKEILLDGLALSLKKVTRYIQERLSLPLQSLAAEKTAYDSCRRLVSEQLKKETIASLQLDGSKSAVCALGAAVDYLCDTKKGDLPGSSTVDYYSDSQFMKLDVSARRNLELTQIMRTGEKKFSLLWVLDKTKTPMGKRLIRSWLERPLVSPAQIISRQNAVEELVDQPILREECTRALAGINDMERLMTRIAYGTANAKELRTLWATIGALPGIRQMLADCKAKILTGIYEEIDLLDDVYALINQAIVEDPPFSIREGGMIRSGFHAEVDELRSIMNDGAGVIASIEAAEKEKTGISKLKIGYNRVFGYYIEVTNSFKEKVPQTYIRKQTLANCERYITQELKELEGKILGAKEKSIALETELFHSVREAVAGELSRVQATANAIARLDCLCSLAAVAADRHYVRPQLTTDGSLEIKNGRHPVVETILDAPFVPNDACLDMNDNRVAIITGPNMAGKSTYMRQIAVIVLMAQMGSFVPADSAKIPIVDAIFTRVGASDDLSGGQSTFMVEMNEVASILKNATAGSLILLDEIGRGTSTFDGMSIARAVLEFVAAKKRLGAKTLFATHYHELTVLEGMVDGVKNYSIAVKKRGDDITFLRRIVRGGADESFGIEVAKLAGVPHSVVKRAKVILKELESQSPKTVLPRESNNVVYEEEPQISLSASSGSNVIEQLRQIDVNTLTPIEALQLLYELKKQAGENS